MPHAALSRPPACEILAELASRDTVIFIDSGNYEAYRFGDEFWQRSPWLLREASARVRCDAIFSHDRIVDVNDSANVSVADLATRLAADVARDRQATGRTDISPIIHAPRANDGTFLSAYVPELCAAVSRATKPPLIAVAERELGDGILNRAWRVRSIRRALDRVGHSQPLHILGTGNPLSMLILAFAGGDISTG